VQQSTIKAGLSAREPARKRAGEAAAKWEGFPLPEAEGCVIWGYPTKIEGVPCKKREERCSQKAPSLLVVPPCCQTAFRSALLPNRRHVST
jgi:hypothetical protein